MSDFEIVATDFGFFSRVKVHTGVNTFAQVEAACDAANYVAPKRPGYMEAVTRAYNAINRTGNNLTVQPGSPLSTWLDANGFRKSGDRNPLYSLKLEKVPVARTDAGETYSAHVINKRAKTSVCVLEVTFQNGYPVQWMQREGFADFGADVQALIEAEHDKFYCNFDSDADVRPLIYREIDKLRGLEIEGKTTVFFQRAPKDGATEEETAAYVERITTLVRFIKACGHVCRPLELKATAANSETLLEDLIDGIMAKFDKYEEGLDEKLGKVNPHRQRRDKRREQMHEASLDSLKEIQAFAEYHKLMLGCVSVQSIDERMAELEAKTRQLLEVVAGPIVTAPAQAPAEADAPVIEEAPADPADYQVSTDAADPFAGVQ